MSTLNNYLIIDLANSYDKKLVMPFDDGIKFLAQLTNTEVFIDSYSSGKSIKPITSNDLSFKILGNQEYAEYKLAATLCQPKE